MIAFLRGEPGDSVVRNIFADPSTRCLAHSANVCEVFYDFIRAAGESTAESAIQDLISLGLSIRADLDTDFWHDAGRLKAAHRMSLADSFGLALTRREAGTFISADHHELDPLVPLGICQIHFIR